MSIRPQWIAFLAISLAATGSHAQDNSLNELLEAEITNIRDISEVVITHCPVEWDAVMAWKPEPNNWTENVSVGDHPALDQAVTQAHHKYVASIISLTEHVASMVQIWNTEAPTQSLFDQAKTEFELAKCLMLDSAEQDLVARILLTADASKSREEARQIMFHMYDEMDCTGFVNLATETLLLDPADPSYAANQANVMASGANTCG